MGHEQKPGNDICGIVSSFAARPDSSVEQIVDLFTRLRSVELSGPGPVPGPVRNGSDDPGHVTCRVCGRPFKMLKRHLRTAHGVSEMEYRVRFGLGEETPLVAPDYSRHKAAQARASGLGTRKADQGA